MATAVKHNGDQLAVNRRARFDYQIVDTYEAGLVLTGTEVKSLRAGKVSIDQAYAGMDKDKIRLFGLYIEEYKLAGRHLQHEPRRTRDLLLKQKEIDKISAALQRDGMTMVPISLYFNARGRVKMQIGLAKGKREVEKRDAIKERDWQRQKSRILRERNK